MLPNYFITTFVLILPSFTVESRSQVNKWCLLDPLECESNSLSPVLNNDSDKSTSWRISAMFFGPPDFNHFLNVCRLPASKVTQNDVKTSLDTTIRHYQSLFDAMVDSDYETLLVVIKKAHEIIPQSIASVKGAVLSMVNTSTGLQQLQMECTQQVRMRVRMLRLVLAETHNQTERALNQLEKLKLDPIFPNALKMFKEVMATIELFVNDSSYSDDLLRNCQRLDVRDKLRYLSFWIPKNFEWQLKQLKYQNRETKMNSVKLVTGLYFETNILNAFCSAVRHANKSPEYQVQVMGEDIRNGERGLVP